MSELKKPLTLISGTSLILNIVIGAGLLSLPGLAFKQAGDFALLSWIVCALVSLPLLAIFILLGRKYPNAGGVAHFTKIAFGSNGYMAASLVFLGAVAFGLPSIALTGGYYAAGLFGGSPHLIALIILAAAAIMHLLSSTLIARINTAMSAVIIATMFSLIAIGYYSIDPQSSANAVKIVPEINSIPIIFAPFMMIFFAFTGWEIAAGLSEEFKNPKRDFALAMITSFVLAVTLYLSIAYIIQKSDISSSFETAFAQIASNALGVSGQITISLIATLIIFANLSAAIWAVSRLIFSLSRETFLPKVLQKTSNGSPYLAMSLTTSVIAGVIILDWSGYLGLEFMLALAGQNFLVLYGVAATAYFCVSKALWKRLLASMTVVIVVTLVAAQGLLSVYPISLMVIGIIIAQLGKRIGHKGICQSV